ncbi:L-threonine ammonia-lyase [Tamaricihabitans halophyticus]|uniref:threonine ammonia-lyase n=1 Tax=Tamaricihabitans halophyticus TaxID=1262583 RepID=A0A4R2QSH5_9PSEU|nr:threonine/serine dehydratase [Tamaricihabitans halophyticus]TCP50001.1 L-threonine ammonia-lyase [Tamaricihabitans halophyticus]
MISSSEIQRAYPTLKPYLRRTPILRLGPGDLGTPGTPGSAATLTLKLEQLQRAGSFKTRGAFANLLLREIPRAGVVAASGGNHGAAVAYAAQQLGVAATIFVPTISAPAKIERIERFGAKLVVGGDRYADALEAARRHIADTGALDIPAFDQPETLLGAGTLGLELAEQTSEVDTVLVPVGGSGLIGGIAAYFAGSVRVIGVEPSAAPTLTAALAQGAPTDAPTGGIAADALAPKRIGELPFDIARSFVHDVVLVEDADIQRARTLLWETVRVIAEPAASVGVAAVLSGAYQPEADERVAIVVSGANSTVNWPE